jgi:putative N-acetylmannosamine-6-phosphate epimerase/predicted NBD/HSP70 family sugar kinase
MTISDLLAALRECPIVASVQGSPGSPVEKPEYLLPMAEASVQEGVKILRLEGVGAINHIRAHIDLPVMGLLKRHYEGFEVYVTPTHVEVDELIATGAEMIALDATRRPRPNGEQLADLVERIHGAGRLAMADCDSVASIHYAMLCGADFVSTTLAGYTLQTGRPSPPPPSASAHEHRARRGGSEGPDLEFVRAAVRESSIPVVAEGRFTQPFQAQAALRMGAAGVVIGGAINDPIKQTRAFVGPTRRPSGLVGAVDIGGTWLRFGVFDATGQMLGVDRIALPKKRDEREDWIRDQVEKSGVTRLGVGSGGTIDPASGTVVEAKEEIIPDHVGARFTEREFGVATFALNDGLATAWGHGCHPSFAGLRVATLAFGTGVGCGFVDRMRLQVGSHGEYPRLNDLGVLAGQSFEELLGGAALAGLMDEAEAQDKARLAAVRAIRTLQALYLPDVVVLCGGVGLSDWLGLEEMTTVVRSPFGEDAGIYGAAWLAIMPPSLV